MGDQIERVHSSPFDGADRLLNSAEIARRISFMGADHIDPAPVEHLNVHRSHSILMKSGHDQSPSGTGEFDRQVERPFLAGTFDRAVRSEERRVGKEWRWGWCVSGCTSREGT